MSEARLKGNQVDTIEAVCQKLGVAVMAVSAIAEVGLPDDDSLIGLRILLSDAKSTLTEMCGKGE